MNGAVSNRIEELRQLCQAYRVKTMYAFGSACADNFNEASDIDLLISFDSLTIDQYTENYFELHYRLEDLFNRLVDLLTDRSLSTPYFISELDRTKQLIYAN